MAVGVELFGERDYAEVEISDIAARAGVSRGLLYRYFPDKAGLFAAVVRSQLDGMAELTYTSGSAAAGTASERILAGLDAYFDYIVAHPNWYRALYRGGTGVDSQVRAMVENAYERQAEQILEQLGLESPDSEQVVAVRCWIAFLATAGLSLLDGAVDSRVWLRERCADALFAAVRPGT
ncbi:TetR/AcrR family transcriptional regulator [Pseudonocardia ammonioxydans]|uniref:TetR/AcrR family transcriptional regulator n=1 Tax=Pseudonocardia ammonioxydans TaxID=260086 RepID=UPI0015A5D5FA|nr:TetR/AcrR family transcriptional regulator [Pseudonocardia ammonioxydans]